MRVMITGAAGNLGGLLARSMVKGPHELRLMIHQQALGYELDLEKVEIVQADLGQPATLNAVCEGVDCIVHFAGVLFQPRPERFLARTNIDYVDHLLQAAQAARIGKFILVSFPHVEGESHPDRRAQGGLDGQPDSIHAQTRLAAERLLFQASHETALQPIVLRPGMIYGRGVLMIEAARRLMRWGSLPVWRKPTWIHLLALPDFLRAVEVAIDHPSLRGVVNLGDDHPLTLQDFLDQVARHWGFPQPLRCPSWSFYMAATMVELFASIFGTAAPITRDFIRIGMASYTADISRMKQELLPILEYPSIREGLALL
ncbi:MAG: NAD-dependent epimerase/dehydratase family protein [Anaerolineales bacterium]|nr:MAG: NAD-dependent epimerase/dehydratase family protein [Anaerolineales bacterium]